MPRPRRDGGIRHPARRGEAGGQCVQAAGQGPLAGGAEPHPYLKDGRGTADQLAAAARKYTDAGYVFVLQDVRGKGHSQGFYQAYVTDIEDGYDSVEWAAGQPWSNGRVGITGASALGVTANSAAMANPPHLKAAYVVVAPYDRLHSSFMGGVIKEKDTVGWLKGQSVSDAEIEQTRGRVADDVFWNRFAMSTNRKYIAVPIYNVGGWYDIFNQGNTSNFTYLQNQGSKGARGNQKLLMGPFGHGPLSGDLAYPGQDQLQGAFGNELRWFDYWLKGVDNGIMDEPPVSYFMMAGARKGRLAEEPHADLGQLAAGQPRGPLLPVARQGADHQGSGGDRRQAQLQIRSGQSGGHLRRRKPDL
uniref:CocE/NonD family hydrolase n=1 Tax=Phenylobacterium glaciei TaxID=2803784 RepID=A0A974P4X2_9CAUL|nr:CocE/NonD family hydrolase [Phenylobacterium glaciei]